MWARSLCATQIGFVDALESLGFSQVPGTDRLEGQLEVMGLGEVTTFVDLEIEIPNSFPFQPPKVKDASMTAERTWHLERDWTLCLYGSRGVADRPWLDPDEFLARVRDWYQNAASGWPDDPPDLDLERYFDQADFFVTYNKIESYLGKSVSATDNGEGWLCIDRIGYVPKNKRQRKLKKRWWGWVGDIGELSAPVFDWPSIFGLLGPNAEKVEGRILNGDYQFLALRYQRKDHSGVLTVFPTGQSGEVQLRAATSAADDDQIRTLRAGDPRKVRELGKRSVAIVGVGAVGSFLADHLARAGVGRLHLIDFDLLRPGNCIRHLVGYDYVGRKKTKAVRKQITKQQFMDPASIATSEVKLGPDLAAELLVEADVVVDATADDNVRELLVHLHNAASTQGIDSTVVSVAVHRSGGIIRSDRWQRGDQNILAPIPEHPDGELELREGGCGDPVSPTPAVAVVEAAGLACRHIADALTREAALPDSIIQILIPQPDAPYQSLGTLAQ